ncbi:putative f-box tpr repeat containing protein pof3 [Erysiphe neolycopersici]|uniref:Putative f-box tpr repeat containing protein pof3 n=1 Tax=Erysiphe neolycopersici TaxID=212602 RepID=A0A420I3B6_9PEZI|nr:putative f-box tpr repeat containing protein pof3 [Erysiphe neolycopersici]
MIQIPSIEQFAEKSCDPFHYLPLELAEKIFHMLSIHNRLTCLYVCKSWNTLLQSSHSLWKILDLSDARRYVPMDGLKAYLKRSNYSLNLAEFQLNSFVDSGRIEYIIENCKCLKELKVYGRDWRGNMMFNSLSSAKQIMLLYISNRIHMSLSVVISTLKRCQDTVVDVTFGNLDRTILNISDWPRLHKLRSLSLGEFDEGYLNGDDEAVIDLDGLVQATPNLITVIIKHLRVKDNVKVYDFRLWKQLQRLEFFNNRLIHFPKLPKTLKHLRFDGNYALSIPESQEMELTQLPLLETFSCQSTSINPRGLFAVTKSCIEANNLKILHLGNRTYNLGNHIILPVWMEYPSCISVEELSLAWMDLDDAGIFRILKLYPKLERIILSGNNITELTLQTLAGKKSIKSIVIDNCYDIDPNLIEEIRHKGIEISWRFASDAFDEDIVL